MSMKTNKAENLISSDALHECLYVSACRGSHVYYQQKYQNVTAGILLQQSSSLSIVHVSGSYTVSMILRERLHDAMSLSVASEPPPPSGSEEHHQN